MPLPTSSGTHWNPPSPAELEKQLTGYEVSRLLGQGGMGAVFEGRQINLDRRVAIKLLPSALHRSDEGAELSYADRFRQEAQAMAKLDHPAIVNVYDFGQTEEDDFYFVMEFIGGMDIHQYLHSRGGKIPGKDALAIVAHVLDGLQYAHENGIAHRDIKPANILLNSKGRVKIADFGLAKSFETKKEAPTPQLTMAGMAIGTPDYAAPELTRDGATPDHRADLYAVGVMLYQLLTGEVPRGRWHPPSEVETGVDPRFDAIVEKALESDPDDRYPSASAFRADLDKILTAPKPKDTGTAPVKMRLMTGPVKTRTKTETAATRLTVADLAGESGDETGDGAAKKKKWIWGAAIGGPVVALGIVFLAISGKNGDADSDAAPETSGGDLAATKPEAGGDAYAKIGEDLENAMQERGLESGDRDGVGFFQDAPKASDEKIAEVAAKIGAEADGKKESPARMDYPVPEPGEYTADPIAEAGPPVVGRWRPLYDLAAKQNESGDDLLFRLPDGGKDAEAVEFPEPQKTVLFRWRGYRGNSFSFSGDDWRYSQHSGSAGGSAQMTWPGSGEGPARAFDSQWFLLVNGAEAFRWKIHHASPLSREIPDRHGNAEKLARGRISGGNTHELPYRNPAFLRQCDALIPTPEQFAEITAARTTDDLLAIPWVPFPEDAELHGFFEEFDRACEKLIAGDIAVAKGEAQQLLDASALHEENPYRLVLDSIVQTADALAAIQKAAGEKSPWPDELPGNFHYRREAKTGHAFVFLPVFLFREEAAAYAKKMGGHLATLGSADDSQTRLIHDWLTTPVPRPILPRDGRRMHAYHLGATRTGQSAESAWSWQTGEPLTAGDTNWGQGEPGSLYDSREFVALAWSAPRDPANPKKRAPSLGWKAIAGDQMAFPLIEFPAPGARYPNAEFNHPAARDAAPGSTGDPLLDFENRFSHQWRDTVEKPRAALKAALREKYAGALESQARAIANAGDLDAVLPWHFEIETILTGHAPAVLGSDAPEELRRLRGIWDGEWKKIEARRKTLAAQAIAAADTELAALEKQLVQQQKIERAAEVKKRRAELNQKTQITP